LHGRSGHEIVARFTVENTDPTPTTVEFEFEPCRAPHGESFHAPITVQPPRLDLEPGGSAEVLLHVALMPSVFMPGLIYHQPIHALGGKPLTLDVTLWVEFEDDLPAAPRVADAPEPAAAPVAKARAKRPAPAPKANSTRAAKAGATKATAKKEATPTKRAAKKTSSRTGTRPRRPASGH
jgi:hypothetical protein